MQKNKLARLGAQLAALGKGVLAADESTPTLTKRFESLGIPCTPETRCAYRTLLFSTREPMASYISGVILYYETLHQKTGDATPLPKLIEESGALVGLKVDTGLKPFPLSPQEKITSGLDTLRALLQEDMCQHYVRFTKWRAVFTISDNLPTRACVEANVEALAQYAALVQEHDMVPILEPEVLMDGTHTAEKCYAVTSYILTKLLERLRVYDVDLEGLIFKTNMIVAGALCPQKISSEETAILTRRFLSNILPPIMPGVLFLSGGQSEIDATEKLNIMNVMQPTAWPLSFSFGRALQDSVLKTWRGLPENVAAAQKTFQHRAHMNSLATRGKWDRVLENAVSAVPIV